MTRNTVMECMPIDTKSLPLVFPINIDLERNSELALCFSFLCGH